MYFRRSAQLVCQAPLYGAAGRFAHAMTSSVSANAARSALSLAMPPSYCMMGDRLAAEAVKLTAELGHGFTARMRGDPRGVALIVSVPSGHSDDWGGRGLCVPH